MAKKLEFIQHPHDADFQTARIDGLPNHIYYAICYEHIEDEYKASFVVNFNTSENFGLEKTLEKAIEKCQEHFNNIIKLNVEEQ